MTETTPTDPTVTSPVTPTPPPTNAQPWTPPAPPVSPATVDTTVPPSDPSDPASQPPASQPVNSVPIADPAPIQPAGPSLDAKAAQQFALFQAWLASNEAQAAQAAQSGAVTAGPSHHVYHSSVDVPEGVENAFQTSKGLTIYVAEDTDGNTRTYSVSPNGSTHSVEGDVYDAVTTVADLLGL